MPSEDTPDSAEHTTGAASDDAEESKEEGPDNALEAPEDAPDAGQETPDGPEEEQQEDLPEQDSALAGAGQQGPAPDTGGAAGLKSIPAAAGQPAAGEEDLHLQSYARQDEWNMILVNRWNPLPEGHTVETSSLINGESVDSRCYSALQEMLSDCAEAGGTPIVCSSYRPHEKQVNLYEEQVQKEMKNGLDREKAEAEAATAVAVPGTSEHELGLAVDICDSENQNLDETQADTPTQKWLMEHCWEYGFILRYPLEKSDITGIIFEPWHYRYVGTEDAVKIHDRGICLEEYLAE